MSTKNENVSGELTVEQLDHISLTVSDLEASRKWYDEILGLKSLQADTDTFVPYVSNGKVNIALHPVRDGEPFKPPAYQGSRGTHVAFKVSGDAYKGFQNRLAELKVKCEELDHGYALSMYFSDPDGYVIELTTYDV